MNKHMKMALKLHSDSLIGYLAAESVFGLGGVAVSMLVIFSEEAATAWISGASLMALVGLTFTSLIRAVTYRQEFERMLSMGRTRKEFMSYYALRTIIWVFLGYALVLVIYAVEQSIYPRIFSLPESAEMTHFWVNWPFVLVYMTSMVVLSMFVGTLIGRFGKKCAIVLYFLWMGVCMNTSRIVEMVEAAQTGSGPLAWALTVPAVVWISVGSAALAAMVYGIVHMGMKQMVR